MIVYKTISIAMVILRFVFTCFLCASSSDIKKKTKVNAQKLETVTSFKYLGSAVTDEGFKPEILALRDSTDDSSIDKVETS